MELENTAKHTASPGFPIRKSQSRRVSFGTNKEYKYTPATPLNMLDLEELHNMVNELHNDLRANAKSKLEKNFQNLKQAHSKFNDILEANLGLNTATVTEEDLQDLTAELKELEQLEAILGQSLHKKTEEVQQVSQAVADKEVEFAKQFEEYKTQRKNRMFTLQRESEQAKTLCEHYSNFLGMTAEIRANSVACEVAVKDKKMNFEVRNEGKLFHYTPGEANFSLDNMVGHEFSNLTRFEYEIVMWRLFRGLCLD